MTGPDVPPDVAAVGRDDEAIELLRTAGFPPAGAQDADPGLLLLSALLADVSAPPSLAGATLLAMDQLSTQRHRHVLRRSSAIAAAAVGLLALGGVAAASPGSPLYGVRHTVTDAVGAVVHAVGVDARASGGRDVPPRGTQGQASVSMTAARRVALLLTRAEAALRDGRTHDAAELLALVDATLPVVLPGDGRQALTVRADTLRAELAAAPSGTPPLEGEHARGGDAGAAAGVVPEHHADGGSTGAGADGSGTGGGGAGGDSSGGRSGDGSGATGSGDHGSGFGGGSGGGDGGSSGGPGPGTAPSTSPSSDGGDGGSSGSDHGGSPSPNPGATQSPGPSDSGRGGDGGRGGGGPGVPSPGASPSSGHHSQDAAQPSIDASA